MINKRLPEILAPAGSFEVLKAAVFAGADAVYIGGRQFNARMSAKNFDREALKEAVEFCHARGVKLYVTFNTLVYDRQFKEALEFAGFLEKIGVDAIIIADIGLSVEISKRFPKLHLHASTQATGHNVEATKYLKDLGFTRMVCSRELSRENIKYLRENSPIEIEAFVHGALCVSQSGQCLFSSIIGGRSGNRGECAQPCRLPYNGKYPLSLKDNCLAEYVTELIDFGVSSLKIEGRMKSPDYVYSAVSLYRKLVDESRNATKREVNELAEVFSRQGFTSGYYNSKLDMSMLGRRTEDDKSSTRNISISIKDNTPKREKITKSNEDSIPFDGTLSFPKTNHEIKSQRTARFYNPSVITPDAKNYFDIIYVPLSRFKKGFANGIVMPPVIPDDEVENVISQLKYAKQNGAVHALVGNIGHISLAKAEGYVLHGDYRLNIYNSFSAEIYSNEFEDIMLSPELIIPQIRDIKFNKSLIVYGKLPLMTLEKKVMCDMLTDRKNVSFKIIEESGRDIVFNSVPVYMADAQAKLKEAGVFNYHFIFTDEGPKMVESVIQSYKKGLPTKKDIRRIK